MTAAQLAALQAECDRIDAICGYAGLAVVFVAVVGAILPAALMALTGQPG